jgi:vacuolar-type H+-ATPase subunit H
MFVLTMTFLRSLLRPWVAAPAPPGFLTTAALRWTPAALLAGVAGGLLLGGLLAVLAIGWRRRGVLNRARAEAERIISEAQRRAAEAARQAEMDTRAATLKMREQAEREVETLREELRNLEQRLLKREDLLDQKLDTLSTKEKNLAALETSLTERNQGGAGNLPDRAEPGPGGQRATVGAGS